MGTPRRPLTEAEEAAERAREELDYRMRASVQLKQVQREDALRAAQSRQFYKDLNARQDALPPALPPTRYVDGWSGPEPTEMPLDPAVGVGSGTGGPEEDAAKERRRREYEYLTLKAKAAAASAQPAAPTPEAEDDGEDIDTVIDAAAEQYPGGYAKYRADNGLTLTPEQKEKLDYDKSGAASRGWRPEQYAAVKRAQNGSKDPADKMALISWNNSDSFQSLANPELRPTLRAAPEKPGGYLAKGEAADWARGTITDALDTALAPLAVNENARTIAAAPLQFGQGLWQGTRNMANNGLAIGADAVNDVLNLADPGRAQFERPRITLGESNALLDNGGVLATDAGVIPRLFGQMYAARGPIGKGSPGGGFGHQAAKDAAAFALTTDHEAPRLADMIASDTPVIGSLVDPMRSLEGEPAIMSMMKNLGEDLTVSGLGYGALKGIEGGVSALTKPKVDPRLAARMEEAVRRGGLEPEPDASTAFAADEVLDDWDDATQQLVPRAEDAGPAMFSASPEPTRRGALSLMARNSDRIAGGAVGATLGGAGDAYAAPGDEPAGGGLPIGAGTGAAIGMFGPRLFATAASRGFRAAARAPRSASGKAAFDERVAARAVRSLLKSGGLRSPDDTLTAMVTRFGDKPAAIADLTQDGVGTAAGLSRLPGSTGETARARGEDLVQNRAGRLERDIADTTGASPGTIAGDVEQMVQAAQAQARPEYDGLRRQYPVGSLASSRLQELRELDIMRPHIAAVERYQSTLGVTEGREIGDFEFWDLVKRSLDAAEQRAIARSEQVPFDLDSTREALLREMDNLVPGYARARQLGGEAPRMQSAFREGQRLLGGLYTAEDVGRLVQQVTGSQLTATQAGVIRAMVGKTEGQRGAIASLMSTGARRKLAAVFGQDAADAMQARFAADAAIVENAHRINPNVGSVTSQAQMGGGLGSLAADAFRAVRNPTEAVLTALSRSGSYSKPQRDLMGQMLLDGATPENLRRIFGRDPSPQPARPAPGGNPPPGGMPAGFGPSPPPGGPSGGAPAAQPMREAAAIHPAEQVMLGDQVNAMRRAGLTDPDIAARLQLQPQDLDQFSNAAGFTPQRRGGMEALVSSAERRVLQMPDEVEDALPAEFGPSPPTRRPDQAGMFPDPVGFRNGRDPKTGKTDRVDFDPRDLVLARNEGDGSYADTGIALGMDPDDPKVTATINQLVQRTRKAIENAKQYSSGIDQLARQWNVTPDELEKFLVRQQKNPNTGRVEAALAKAADIIERSAALGEPVTFQALTDRVRAAGFELSEGTLKSLMSRARNGNAGGHAMSEELQARIRDLPKLPRKDYERAERAGLGAGDVTQMALTGGSGVAGYFGAGDADGDGEISAGERMISAGGSALATGGITGLIRSRMMAGDKPAFRKPNAEAFGALPRNTADPRLDELGQMFEDDASTAKLRKMQMESVANGKVPPVFKTFKLPDGRVMAWDGQAFSHDDVRELLDFGDTPLQHGQFKWNDDLAKTNWYEWSGDPAKRPRPLEAMVNRGQKEGRNVTDIIMDATLDESARDLRAIGAVGPDKGVSNYSHRRKLATDRKIEHEGDTVRWKTGSGRDATVLFGPGGKPGHQSIQFRLDNQTMARVADADSVSISDAMAFQKAMAVVEREVIKRGQDVYLFEGSGPQQNAFYGRMLEQHGAPQGYVGLASTDGRGFALVRRSYYEAELAAGRIDPNRFKAFPSARGNKEVPQWRIDTGRFALPLVGAGASPALFGAQGSDESAPN